MVTTRSKGGKVESWLVPAMKSESDWLWGLCDCSKLLLLYGVRWDDCHD